MSPARCYVATTRRRQSDSFPSTNSEIRFECGVCLCCPLCPSYRAKFSPNNLSLGHPEPSTPKSHTFKTDLSYPIFQITSALLQITSRTALKHILLLISSEDRYLPPLLVTGKTLSLNTCTADVISGVPTATEDPEEILSPLEGPEAAENRR